jgi:hypothetical protein
MTNFLQSSNKAKLIGNVTTVTELEDVIKPADNTHVCLVSESMAKTSANSALSKMILKDGSAAGSRYSIGEPTKQVVDGCFGGFSR